MNLFCYLVDCVTDFRMILRDFLRVADPRNDRDREEQQEGRHRSQNQMLQLVQQAFKVL